jgi:hypothetical protein
LRFPLEKIWPDGRRTDFAKWIDRRQETANKKARLDDSSRAMLTTGTEELNPFVIQDNRCMELFQRLLDARA